MEGKQASAWQILVATLLSLRTKDAVTLASSTRLFAQAPDAATTRRLSIEQVAQLIYPVGFFRNKAKQIHQIALLLERRFDQVPDSRDELLELPGVGPKTANLVLNLAFNIPAICVDTHVHRIPNRLGWIHTANPSESEICLQDLWPRQHWIEANQLFVSFGQHQCTPTSPRCSSCPLAERCLRIGVTHSR